MNRINRRRIFRIIFVLLCCMELTVSYSEGQKLSQGLLEHFHYREIGPTRQGGRIVDFAVPDRNKEPYGVVFNYYLKDTLLDGVTFQVYDGSVLVNELQGPRNVGFNSVVWGMTKRGQKRTEEEIARYDRRVAEDETEPFYDYYDTVDYFGDSDEEVDKRGFSLRTRVARTPGTRGREYVFKRVQPGEYTIKLIAGEKVLTKNSVILRDYWYEKNY